MQGNGSLGALDLEGAARQAEQVLKRLDALRLEAEAMAAEFRRSAEAQAQQWIADLAPPERESEARAVVARGVRVAEEVGAWVVARSPWGLAQRLLPELRAGAGEVARLVAPARKHPPAARESQPPARSAP